MPKLTLKVQPTFQAPVAIPVAGGDPVPVVFTFKHRTKSELQEFVKNRQGQQDVETVLQMVEAWDLVEAFTHTNVQELLENYGGAAVAIFQAYCDQLLGFKAKNS